MPWEEKVIVTMREEFVKRVLSHEKSKGGICYGSQPQRRNLLRLTAATSHCRPAGNESYAAVKPLERRNLLCPTGISA